MKITKRQLRRIIREETFDAKRDAMAQRGTYGAYKSRRPAKSSDYDFLKKDRYQQEKERLDALGDIDFDALKKKGRAILDVLSAGFKDNFAAAAAALGDKKSKFDTDEKRRLRAKEDLQFARNATKTYKDFKPDRLERVMKYFDAYGFDSSILMESMAKQNEYKIEEGAKVKITKKQLQRIIKEEKAKMMQERIEHPLEGAAASAGSIAMGLRKGLLTPESAAQRIEAEVKKVLYDFIRRAKGQ